METGVRNVRRRVSDAARRSGRDPSEVTILAATKYADASTVGHLVGAGVVDVAENRLDALVAKQEAGVGSSWLALAQWHYIGRLQSRQAASIAGRVSAIHTLCTTSASLRLAAAAADGCRPLLLVQVNIDDDPAKDGLYPTDVDRFLDELPPSLEVSGLMTMPAFTEDPQRSRRAFAALRDLRDRLADRHSGRHPLQLLSMGTSQDFEVAVEEGATHVRLGKVLYAPNA